MFCPGVFSRFILASLCSFVKARSGDLGKLRANYGQDGEASAGKGARLRGHFPSKLNRGAAVFFSNSKHPAPVKPCNRYAVFFRPCPSQGKNKHPLPLHAFGIVPSGGVFRASFGLHTGKTGDAIPITAAPFFFCWGIDDHQRAAFIHQ